MTKGKVSVFILFAFAVVALHADIVRVEPNALVRVADDHSSVLAMVTNSTTEDIFCDSIGLDIVRTGRDYNDFASRAHTHSGPVYLAQGKQLDLSALGTVEVLAGEGVQGVGAADIDTKLCHAAKFSEYCAYAEKNAEETHTTDLILRTARRECGEAEAVIGRGLELAGQNIRSLKPIGFLRNLHGLSVERNMIEDLSPLKNLSVLQELDISYNPVKDLTPVLGLVAIRSVAANHTLVESNSDPIANLHRRGVNLQLRGTPFSHSRK